MSPVGQQWTDAGAGALSAAYLGMAGCSRLGYGKEPPRFLLLEEVAINPTIKLPELTQGWEIDSWRAQTEPCAPGPRRKEG